MIGKTHLDPARRYFFRNMQECHQIIKTSGRNRARIFAEGLWSDPILLKRLARYWLRVIANKPGGVTNLEACHDLIQSVWIAKPDLGLEASRDGSRHSVILYPFGLIGEDANRYLRLPLRFLNPYMKQAVQCFLSFHELATDFYEASTGMFMAETFTFNDELSRSLEQYRDLLVVCVLRVIGEVAVQWGRNSVEEDHQKSILNLVETSIIMPFVSKFPNLGPKTLKAWQIAIKPDGIQRVSRAIDLIKKKKIKNGS